MCWWPQKWATPYTGTVLFDRIIPVFYFKIWNFVRFNTKSISDAHPSSVNSTTVWFCSYRDGSHQCPSWEKPFPTCELYELSCDTKKWDFRYQMNFDGESVNNNKVKRALEAVWDVQIQSTCHFSVPGPQFSFVLYPQWSQVASFHEECWEFTLLGAVSAGKGFLKYIWTAAFHSVCSVFQIKCWVLKNIQKLNLHSKMEKIN